VAGTVEGSDKAAVGDGIGGPVGELECIGPAVFGSLGHGIVVDLEAIDLGLECAVVMLLVEATSGIEEKLWEILGDDPRRRRETLDVKYGEGNAAASHGEKSRVGLTAQETVEGGRRKWDGWRLRDPGRRRSDGRILYTWWLALVRISSIS